MSTAWPIPPPATPCRYPGAISESHDGPVSTVPYVPGTAHPLTSGVENLSRTNALAISIGVLGAVAVLLTGTLIKVPVWVVFIAWASFFILGGGVSGLLRSVAANVTGVVIAALALLVAQSPDTPDLVLTAVAVGVGSAAMVQASRVGLLSVIPAIVWGFASTVGTAAVTGRAVTTASIGNPALMAAVAMVLGAAFGLASERIGLALTSPSERSVTPVAEEAV